MNSSLIPHATAQCSPAERWLQLPAEMRNRPQWVLAAPNDKAPRRADGGLASPTAPHTWTDFATACAAAVKRGWGVGYVLHRGDPFCCIDLDVKPDTTPDDRARFENIIATMDSYTERSRSGLGWHVWVRANIETGRRRDGVEIYSQQHFIICTGDVVHPLSIAERQDVIDSMISQMAPPAPEIDLTGPNTPDPAAVARAEADAGEMGRLWQGDWQGRYKSQSDADLALVKFLLPLTASTCECWATFRLSVLGKRKKARRPDYAKGTIAAASQHLENDAYHIVRGKEIWEGLLANIDAKASDASASQTAVASRDFHKRTPVNFLNAARAPALETSQLPAPIADFASQYSAAHGFDVSGVVMAAIASAAAMIDDAYVLEAKPGWTISARIWTVLIGRSASGKSPTIKAATRPVREKHAELGQDYDLMCTLLEKGEERPPRHALYTSDSTVEALSDRLADNPRGMLMVTEEFASWIGQIDASTKGDAAKNRGAWLQLYDGGAYQIDRVVRGSISIPNWGASVLTATTPSALADHMRHLPEDGLIQRFIPVILAARNHDADGDASSAQQAWAAALDWIYNNVRPDTVRFEPAARELFRATERQLGRMAEVTDDISPALASHIGKHSEMIARIALVFHVFDNVGKSSRMSANTLGKAIALMKQISRHSHTLFTDILGSAPEAELARALARSLAADGEQQFIARDWMTQHCQAFKKAKDDRVRRAAVQLLEDFDWLQVWGTKVYGGWPTRWEVNRQIARLYAREGEMHRERRAAVKAVFLSEAHEA